MLDSARFAAALFLAAFLLPPLHAGDAFSWRQAEGEYLLAAMPNHPYSAAVMRKIPEFESLTGIRVAYAVFPESGYHDELEARLAGSGGRPDVFMLDVFQAWSLAGHGRLADLDRFLADSALTRSGYNQADFFDRVLGLFRWSGRSGEPAGFGPLWAAPLGFGTIVLAYDRARLSRLRLKPPETLERLPRLAEELESREGGRGAALSIRGGGSFPGSAYFSVYSAFGALDMAWEGGRPAARVNSPEAAAATGFWLDLARHSVRAEPGGTGPPPALILDADVRMRLSGDGAVSGQDRRWGVSSPPAAGGTRPPPPVLLAWGLAVDSRSARRKAAWLFVQYFTDQPFLAFMAIDGGGANPSRRSVFESGEFQAIIRGVEGRAGILADALERGRAPLTPTRRIFRLAGRWAAAIRDIESGLQPSIQAGLDDLNRWLDAGLAEEG